MEDKCLADSTLVPRVSSLATFSSVSFICLIFVLNFCPGVICCSVYPFILPYRRLLSLSHVFSFSVSLSFVPCLLQYCVCRLLPDEPDPLGGGLLSSYPLWHSGGHFGSVVWNLCAPHLHWCLLWIQESCELGNLVLFNLKLLFVDEVCVWGLRVFNNVFSLCSCAGN